jgi:FkbM family methyltransferase
MGSVVVRDWIYSIRSSAARNGWIATASMLGQYLLYRLSWRPIFKFHLPPVHRNVYVRPGESDFSVLRQVFMNGEYDMEAPENVRIIIDAGANIGLSALQFHQRFPEASVIAIEPDPDNFKMLVQNTRHTEKIVPIHAALWHSPAPMRFAHNPGAHAWGTQVEQARPGDALTVPGIGLDDLRKQFGFDGFDIIKMDIEGAEMDMLENEPGRWLNKTRVLIIELHEWLRPGVEDLFNRVTAKLTCTRMKVGENIVVYNQVSP